MHHVVTDHARRRARPAAAVGLLLALLLAVPLALVGAAPAHACRCAPGTTAQQARAADLVLTGTVVAVRDRGPETRERSARPGGQAQQRQQREQREQDQRTRQEQQGRGAQRLGNVTMAVEVERVYAGRVPGARIAVTTAVQTSACGLGALDVGERYVFFLTEDARALRATSCDGTGPATAQQEAAVAAVLGEGRSLGAAADEPVDVELTPVATAGDVPRAAVVAAPGGLLVVLGLLGLAVLAGLGRRT